MTRINKSSFNVREKLTELASKFGLKGTELARAETAQEARDLISAGRKNLIINGACTINQRLGSGTYTLTGTNDYYPVDRFRSWADGGGQFTIQRSDNAPPGFKNSMMYTVSTTDTSVGSSEYYCIQQRIEGYNVAHLGLGTANAKPVTLSFWVKSDIPGTYSGSFFNTGQTYTCVFEYKINQADTWEYKTLTIPAATIGSFTSDSSNYGLGIWWDLGSGTGFNNTPFVWKNAGDFRSANQVPFIGTSGAKFRMTGVQLEVGKNATDFEHRPYGEELTLCQRYYQELPQNSDHVMWGFGRAESNTARVQVPLSTPLRNSPNVTASNFRVCSVDGTHLLSTSSPSVYQWTDKFASIIIDFPSGGSLSHNHVYIVTSNGGTTGLQMNSEL